MASCWYTGLASLPCTTTEAYPACSYTTLRSALQKITSATRESPVPGAAAASTFPRQWHLAGRLDLTPRPALLLIAVHKRTQRALARLYGLRSKRLLRPRENRLFEERLLLLLHSLASGVLLVDWTSPRPALLLIAVQKRTQRALARLYGLHSKTLLRPRENRLFQERLLLLHSLASGVLLVDLTSPRPALLLVLHSCFRLRYTSVPSVLLHDSTVCTPKHYFGHERIACSRSGCYCFYIPSPVASCWQTGLSLVLLHLVLVPSVCCRLWRKRNFPARPFTKTCLALPHEQQSSARSSCRVLSASLLMNSGPRRTPVLAVSCTVLTACSCSEGLRVVTVPRPSIRCAPTVRCCPFPQAYLIS
ncbi:uncharacterized protein [Dermacentor albipictus]|uniref:uncharacterized protein isoform X2 n=1 Tax=Dermacentor albipictus TaxID=60249 RepID=UPI0038FC3993